MKNLFLFILLASYSVVSMSQEIEKTFVPYYQTEDGIQEFERVSSKIEAKAIGFGYGGVNQYLTVFNSKNSPTRFKSGSLPKFLMKLDPGIDPLDLVIISKADVVKKRKTYRRFVQQGHNMGGAKDLSEHLTIPELKPVEGQENLYEMVFKKPLVPGEYAFQPIYKGQQAANILATNNNVRIYCFGID
ncbi:hypothetical protein [Corallibacter sp.]|uniref:hypothetical protein n=1 Tax=Corallibacter sp. TaxID=2038084 RepID=UPI003AB1E830